MAHYRSIVLNTIWALVLLMAGDAAIRSAQAHGSHGGGGEELSAGEVRTTPIITIEGHGGFENNLDGRPQHYAIDGQFGVVLEWGLPNNGSFAIEASMGPSLVWGEAEHFYGRVHVEEHHEEDHHDDIQSGHANHGDSHGSGAPFRRTDIKGFLEARYQPNERLAFSVAWMPYYVTGDEGEDFGTGLKNEVGAQVIYAIGDGDVNFALGDGLEDMVDGVFVSVENRTGWDSDGTFIGNYTDPWLGFGFNVDLLNITLSGGPRFYTTGSYSGLSQRTDWGGEIELEYQVAENVVLFAHWEPVYSTEGGNGWGVGFQHHVGTGLTLSF